MLAMDLERTDHTSERALLLVTALYSASLIVSTSFSEKSCLPMVPMGECTEKSDSLLQHLISFVIAFLAGMSVLFLLIINYINVGTTWYTYHFN